MTFAVFDVETTGLSPAHGDRIVEIGIVVIDQCGTIIEEFESLVNPFRDVGPTHIHGITASMVHDAPSFSQIEGTVLKLLSGTILVGHNIAFDLRFLRSELPALWGPEEGSLPSVCTLRLCRKHLTGLPNNKLESLCAYYGIENELSHSALSDARATARAFTSLSTDFDLFASYPAIPGRRGSVIRGHDPCRSYTRRDHESNIGSNKATLRSFCSSADSVLSRENQEICAEYLSRLAIAMLDRQLRKEDLEDLRKIIETYALDGHQVEMHHQIYLNSLKARYRRRTGRITSLQREDLSRVRRLLLSDREHAIETRVEEELLPSLEGAKVCFTGTLSIMHEGQRLTRTLAEGFALLQGLEVRGYVTTATDYLVASDALSQSTKAKRARRLNVPIIEAGFFFSLLGS